MIPREEQALVADVFYQGVSGVTVLRGGKVVVFVMWGPPRCSQPHGPALLCHSPSGSLQTSPSQICPAPPTAPSPPQHRAPWLSGQKERDPVLPQLPWARGTPEGHIPRPCLPPPLLGALWEGVEGLPTCTMKSQSSTSKAMSFTPSPCFTRCSPISARSRGSHRHEQKGFAVPGPFPTPSPPDTYPRSLGSERMRKQTRSAEEEEGR